MEPEIEENVCSTLKPVPSVLIAKTVPLPRTPPREAVPKRVFPTRVRPADGYAPSLLVYGAEADVAVKL